MAKTRFSINKETLVEERADGYILTRVPNSNMDYYMLLNEDEVLTEDESTIIAEWDSIHEIKILPRIQEEGEIRKPTLKEAIADYKDPVNSIPIEASELYAEYYHYEKSTDPEQREKEKRIREQKRKEALERSDSTKSRIQKTKSNEKTAKNQKTDKKVQEQAAETEGSQEKPQSPAEKMEEQRAQIKHYTKQQFKEIMKGTRQKLATDLYRNVDLSPQQMRELRLSLKANNDITGYNSPHISAKHMRELRIGAKRGVKLQLENLNQSLYDAEQIRELRIGFEKGLKVKEYVDPAYNAMQMREIRLGLQAGLDVAKITDIHMTADQMHAVRFRMVMENIETILKRTFEDIRSWLNEKIEDVAEHLMARYQRRQPMTAEQIKDARINEAVKDIKELVIQSEVISEDAYEEKGLDEEIRKSIESWQDYMEMHPKQEAEVVSKEAAKDVCKAADMELEQPKEKIVNISENSKAKTIEQAAEEAVEEAMQMEEIIEEESFEMMQ